MEKAASWTGTWVSAGGRRDLSRWLRFLCIFSVPVAFLHIVQSLLWFIAPVSAFFSGTNAAYHPLLLVYSFSSLGVAGFILRFAFDSVSLGGWWGPGDARRKVGAALLATNVALALPTAVVGILFVLGAVDDFRRVLTAEMEKMSSDSAAQDSHMAVHRLHLHYECCGLDGPWDWYSKNTSAKFQLRSISRQHSFPNMPPLGCGPLMEVNSEAAEEEGWVCAVPDTCCDLGSRSCTATFLHFARSHSDLIQAPDQFHKLGCVAAFRDDWVARFSALALFFPTLLVLGAKFCVWRLLDTSAAAAAVAREAHKPSRGFLVGRMPEAEEEEETPYREELWTERAESDAVVWGWDDEEMEQYLKAFHDLPDSAGEETEEDDGSNTPSLPVAVV